MNYCFSKTNNSLKFFIIINPNSLYLEHDTEDVMEIILIFGYLLDNIF
jgi:hypothetical protein